MMLLSRIAFNTLPLLFALLQPITSTSFVSVSTIRPNQGSQIYLKRARSSVEFLNKKWYDKSIGQWNNQGNSRWWQSAIALAMIGDFAALDPTYKAAAIDIFALSFAKAARGGGKDHFFGNYYDDMGWWALAWTQAYDVTGNTTYLTAAEVIFDQMLAGLNTTCGDGGIWWSTARNSLSAIANELYLATAATLANRATPEKRDYYKSHAISHWNWFRSQPWISQDYIVCDSLNTKTCKNQGPKCGSFTYAQGVILRALVELQVLQPNEQLLELASKIANATITMKVKNGILHETHMTPILAAFKGPFARNLMLLLQVRPEKSLVDFFRLNSESIWDKDRNATNGQLGPAWEGPFVNESTAKATHQDMPAHISATSGLIGGYFATRYRL
jgi:predicted alpha-1,6-mannanase (GH76 family)